jgi:hypothetical protein
MMSELADFVLNALRQAGGLVDPPAFGIYDVLLPDELAHRWQVPAYQRLSFDEESGVTVGSPIAEAADKAGEGMEEVTAVGYGHPLLETLAEEVRAEPACTQVFANTVRAEKRELLPLARQALSFPNARLSEVPRQSEVTALCHYLRFNFKAALITDEKQEQLVSVVMDVQGGFAVPELVQMERLAQLEDEPSPGRPLPAPVRWLPGAAPLSRPVLDGLLERATEAALRELAPSLDGLRRRAARYLELDRARLDEYYEKIARDLNRRLDRTGDGSEDASQRRAAVKGKLAATQAERQAKLADVEAKYRLRVELELINLQVIHQPKVLLPVHIANRSTRVERTVVWDPLLHRVEPLACDVCGQAATRLMLCSGGHLAHGDCLLPEQCVDCKRVHCRLCTDQMSRCTVCQRPVCVPSLNRCAECGQGTCREHVGLCHAAAGRSLDSSPLPPEHPDRSALQEAPSPPAPSSPPKEEPPIPPSSAEVKDRRAPAQGKPQKGRKAAAPAPRTASPPAHKAPGRPTPSKIEVFVESDAPRVNAFVLTKGRKQVAVRSWEWTDQGILVLCRCEHWFSCPVDGTMLAPADPASIEAQLKAQIEDLRREYGISPRRVLFHTVTHGIARQVPRLTLQAEWKAERGEPSPE